MGLRHGGVAVVLLPLLCAGPEAAATALSSGGVRATFDAARVAMVSGDRTVAMRLQRFGRSGSERPLAAVHPRADGSGVHYVRDGVDEWYREDTHGLEQGFTLGRAPDGEGDVTLELAVDGAEIEKSATGLRLRALDRLITVEGLSVVDADGRALVAKMEPSDHGFAISFDDRGARYPVVVDPYYATETRFVPSGTGTLDAGCKFKRVRAAGTRVYVGMACDFSPRSAIYVLRWNGTALVEEARIEPPSPLNDAYFGQSFDVDDTTPRLVFSSEAQNKVYAYVNPGTGWVQEAVIAAPTSVSARFGAGLSYGAWGSGGDLIVWGYPNRIYTYSRTGSAYTRLNDITASFSGSLLSEYLVVRQHRMLLLAGYPTSAGSPIDSFSYGTTWASDGKVGNTIGAVTFAMGNGSSFLFGPQLYALSGTFFSLQHTFTGSGAYSLNGDVAIGTLSNVLTVYQRTGSAWSTLGAASTALTPKLSVAPIDATRSVSDNNTDVHLNLFNVSKANGAACAAAIECTSNFCADGVCCDTSCTSSCTACTAAKKGSGLDGVCGAVPNGSTGKGTCSNAMTTCGPDGLCDGTGKCRVGAAAGTSCGATMCSAGSVTGPTCNGAGSCSTTPRSCAPYLCKDATSCATGCTTDAECAAPNVCVSGACRAKLANGAPTPSATACVSGLAADGVCCDTTCDGACVACTAAKTGGADGTCSPIKSGTDPDNDCKARCMGASLVGKGACDGAGKCSDGALASCAPYGCEAGACKTKCFDDSDCSGAKCAAGICSSAPPDAGSIAMDGGAPLVTGTFQTCTSATECPSGFCVDGVCCDSACTETCRACNLPFAPGRCAVVPAGLDPKRSCGGDKSCHQTCDGVGSCMSTRPGDQCAAAKCTDRSHGVGAAVCPAADAPCPTSSAAFDCGAYACVEAFGACATRCGGSAECAAGFACETSTGQCTAIPPAGDDGGCALGRSASSPLALLAFLSCAIGLARRRRGAAARGGRAPRSRGRR